jgi:hypothetical protein
VKDADRRRKYYEAEYAKALRRKVAGLCVSCGSPISEVHPLTGAPFVNCATCRAKKLAQRKARASGEYDGAVRAPSTVYRATNPNDDPVEGDAQEVAQLLGMSETWVRALARNHKISRHGWSISRIEGGPDESKSSLTV